MLQGGWEAIPSRFHGGGWKRETSLKENRTPLGEKQGKDVTDRAAHSTATFSAQATVYPGLG